MDNLSRRRFVKATVALGAGSLLLPKTIMADPGIQQEKPTLKGKKVLYVWGGWKGHEPEQSVDLFVPWLKSEGANVTVSDTLDAYLDEELMGSLDLIIQIWTMGEILREQETGLLNAVKRGVGFAGWHGGIGDSFRNNVEYQFMVGGQWVAHPGGIIDYRVNI
ncbi:MAG: ThuA domain-containing protein, partial [Bacteroidota bacterium]|nr:ThuA domain-containing protein [Bacteroidota bacterium]